MIRRPRPTVRLRLTLAYTCLFVVTGAALLGVSYLLVRQKESGAATATQIICRARAASGLLKTTVEGVPAPGAGPGNLVINRAACPGVVGSVYHSLGSGPASGQVSQPTAPLALRPLGVSGQTAAEVSGLAATVRASQAHTLNAFKFASALALGLLTIVAFGLSWWMAGRALRPVHRITAAARSLSERTLHDRINLRGPNDELKQLADTFDAMLGRLDRAFHSQRRFVANASHELRTPLATERVLIDEALANRSASPDELRSILEQLRTNSEDTERLIDALLVLARSERGVEQWSPVDLSEAVSSVVEQSSIEAAAGGVAITTDLEPTVVSGDRGLIERLAGNLIENAIRHNRAGGTLSVATRRDRGDAVLDVANSGPVLDPGAVPGLVEPFRRGGPDRSDEGSGVGLGLSIVNAIVDAHHGTLVLTAPPEGGLQAQVRLPATEDGDAPQRAVMKGRSGEVTTRSGSGSLRPPRVV